jgi:hypothetical protein
MSGGQLLSPYDFQAFSRDSMTFCGALTRPIWGDTGAVRLGRDACAKNIERGARAPLSILE